MAGPAPLLLGMHRHHVHHEQAHHQGQDEDQDRRGRRRRAVWVREILTEQQRRDLGHYTLLHIDLQDDASIQMFRNYTRFTPQTFIEIFNRIEPIISKQDTNMRQSLEPGFKLAVRLRYLATGDSYMSLKYAFRCGHNTISLFIPEVCQAIIQVYQQEALPGVCTEEGWKAVAQGFQERWNMPHCMGALDGKHCPLKKPKNCGSVYYNYKGFFSIPLLALVDAGYKFLWAELGGFGSMSDAQIFLETDLRDALETNDANRPPACPLTQDPEDTVDVPYFIVSDDAFALRDFCLKPYSRKTMDR